MTVDSVALVISLDAGQQLVLGCQVSTSKKLPNVLTMVMKGSCSLVQVVKPEKKSIKKSLIDTQKIVLYFIEPDKKS